MFKMFPLLALSLVIYTILTFTIGTAGGTSWIDRPIIDITMVSGDVWKITYGYAFIIGSMALLFVELLRSTQTGTDSILNHAFSVVVFIVSLLLFIIIKGYGNSIFFVFLTMTFLDFMAGFIVTTVTARRDFGVAQGALG